MVQRACGKVHMVDHRHCPARSIPSTLAHLRPIMTTATRPQGIHAARRHPAAHQRALRLGRPRERPHVKPVHARPQPAQHPRVRAPLLLLAPEEEALLQGPRHDRLGQRLDKGVRGQHRQRRDPRAAPDGRVLPGPHEVEAVEEMILLAAAVLLWYCVVGWLVGWLGSVRRGSRVDRNKGPTRNTYLSLPPLTAPPLSGCSISMGPSRFKKNHRLSSCRWWTPSGSMSSARASAAAWHPGTGAGCWCRIVLCVYVGYGWVLYAVEWHASTRRPLSIQSDGGSNVPSLVYIELGQQRVLAW